MSEEDLNEWFTKIKDNPAIFSGSPEANASANFFKASNPFASNSISVPKIEFNKEPIVSAGASIAAKAYNTPPKAATAELLSPVIFICPSASKEILLNAVK